jgi:hypothetical protein
MNRSLTAVFAALESSLVVAIGIGIPLAPLTVLWATQYGFQVDWAVFWRASVDTWLIGHGVDLAFTLPKSIASALGLENADASFSVTLAALGFALLTFLLGIRAGRRVSETRFRAFGEVVAVAVFGALAFVLQLTANTAAAHADPFLAVVQPTVVFGLGVALGSILTRRAAGDDNGSSIADWVADWRPATRASVGAALRVAASAVAMTVLAAAILLAVLIAAGYARIVTLYENLHTELLGGITLTLAQLALLPDLVIWGVSWLVGPGFALGTGSSVSPLSTSVGPLPAVPVLGALPDGAFSWGFLGLIVPVVAGFLGGAFSRLEGASTVRRVATGVGAGVVAGVLIGLLAWFAAGSAGPGRLVDLGPDPVLVGALAALEIGIGAAIGLAVAGRGRREAEH